MFKNKKEQISVDKGLGGAIEKKAVYRHHQRAMHFAPTLSDVSAQVNAPTRHCELATTKRSSNQIKVTIITYVLVTPLKML